MNDDFYRKSNPIATAFWLIVLIVGVVFFFYTLVQAIVQEENNKRTYKAHYSQQETLGTETTIKGDYYVWKPIKSRCWRCN